MRRSHPARGAPAGRSAAVVLLGSFLLVTTAAAAPTIRGRVLTAAGSPVAGAAVTAGAQQATTDAQGRFALAIESDWPSEVAIAKARYGTKRIALSPVHASSTLGDIRLARAAQLTVRVERGVVDEPIEVQLGLRDADAATRWIETRTLAPSERAAVFDDVDTGTYAVLVAGAQPLERIVTPVGIVAGEKRTLTTALRPTLVRGRVTVAGKPFAGAEVMFTKPQAFWKSTAVTDANGEVDTRTWDHGDYNIYVTRTADRVPLRASVTLHDLPLATFSVELPDRVLRGRVLDEGRPVAGAVVIAGLRGERDEPPPWRRAVTAEDGSFAFDGIASGKFELRVLPVSRLRPDPVRFAIDETEKEHRLDVTLPRGLTREVVVLDSHGALLADASVVCAEGDTVRSVARTDAAGRASAVLPADPATTLYVFPANGSLAVRHLEREPAAGTIRIGVPPPAAALEINTLTTTGAPLPEVALLMRYNGEVVPPSVAAELRKRQGSTLETDADGSTRLANIPTGTYEFWPYRTAEEAEALLVSSIAVEAPITVHVVTGENKATVRFQSRQ